MRRENKRCLPAVMIPRHLALLVLLAALVILTACDSDDSQAEGSQGPAVVAADTDGGNAGDPAPRPAGLITSTHGVSPGYVLFSPLSSGVTYLLDQAGEAVHTWQSDYAPHSLYLLENGNLLRPGRDPDAPNFMAGGAMGLLEEFTWDGERVWFYKLSDDNRILHHDIEPLPNGNFLAIGWEQKSQKEALAVGRRADLIPEGGLWPDFLVEIEPIRPDGARIVWTWHTWDHLVQNVDPRAPELWRNPKIIPGGLTSMH